MTNASSPVADHIVSLARELGERLRGQHLMLVTAESCTAGGIAYAVTQVPGSSEWFDRGFVTYSNAAKQQHLGVSAAYLRDFGAVSEPVARTMALGAIAQSHAHIAVAATGIAGPGGGSEDKPVGTVCLAWAIKRDPASAPWVRTTTRRFEGERAAVRTQAIIEALDGLIDLLKQRQDV